MGFQGLDRGAQEGVCPDARLARYSNPCSIQTLDNGCHRVCRPLLCRSYVGKEPRNRPVGPTTATVLLQQRSAAAAAEQQHLQQPCPHMQQQQQQGAALPPPHTYGVPLSEAEAARLRAVVSQQLPPAPRYSVQRHLPQPAHVAAAPMVMHPQQQYAQQQLHQGPHQPYPVSGAPCAAMPAPGAAPAVAGPRPASLPAGPLQVQHSGDVVVGAATAAGAVPRQYHPHHAHYGGSQPVSGGQSLENIPPPPPGGSAAFPPHLTHPYHQYYHPSYPASQVAWDSVSLAETEPLPGEDTGHLQAVAVCLHVAEGGCAPGAQVKQVLKGFKAVAEAC